MRCFCTLSLLAVAVLLGLPTGLTGQEKADWEVVSKIREEGFQRSQVMDIVGYMSDVLGPRLTASPSMRKAQEWAQEKMREAGLQNVALERAGEHGVNWDNDYTSLHMIAPDYQPIIGYAKAFTAGTAGKLEEEAVIVHIETPADFDRYRGTLNGKIVLLEPPFETEPHFTPDAVRHTDETLEALSRTSVGEGGGQQETVTLTMQQLQELMAGGGPGAQDDPETVSRAELDEFLLEHLGAKMPGIFSCVS